jgi:hypothetical protein
VPAAITQLRAEIEALPVSQRGARKGVSEALRRRVATLWKQSGMTTSEFAQATALSESSVWRWTRGRQKISKSLPKAARAEPVHGAAGKGESFKKVRVLEDPPQKLRGLTLEGPGGMRISGLGVEEVARLWKVLC